MLEFHTELISEVDRPDKTTVMKSIENDAQVRELLFGVGVDPELSTDVASAIEEFVLIKIYNSN